MTNTAKARSLTSIFATPLLLLWVCAILGWFGWATTTIGDQDQTCETHQMCFSQVDR